MERILKTCGCGRAIGPVRPRKFRREDDTSFVAPWCVGKCAPYTPEELADPKFVKWLTCLPRPEYLDETIRPYIRICTEAGALTLTSCSGHGAQGGYIVFFDQASLDIADKALADFPHTIGLRKMGRLFGPEPFPTIFFPIHPTLPVDIMTSNMILLGQLVRRAANVGYAFAADAFTPEACEALAEEMDTLRLEVGDHVTKPINAGSPREVRQLHARAYFPIGHWRVPIATHVTNDIVNRVQALGHAELMEWRPTEAGYQHYRGPTDWISPHRDRRNDRLLSVTITISGSAGVRVLEPLGDPDDYSNLRVIAEFQTTPGSVMVLRAPGFGLPGQVIHEVLPPTDGDRRILNLRMRPNILPPPESA